MLRGGLLIALILASPVFAAGLLEKNHPAVEAGIDAYADGRFEDALAAFKAAKQELPGDPRIDFNIGNALYKLGRYEEAKDAWQLAAENDKGRGALQQKDYYNLGNAWAQLNKKKEALAAYRKALTLDPSDQMARHNLEVLMRNIPPQDPPQQGDGGQDGGTDGGTPDGGQDGGHDGGSPDGGSDGGTDGGSAPDGGSDGGSDGGTDGGSDGGSDGGTDGGSDGGTGDGGTGDGGTSDAGHSDGGPSDGGHPDGGTRDGGSDPGEEGRDGGTDGGTASGGELEPADGGTQANLSEQDAEKLLDSMKQNEKNLQLWRFQQQKPRKAHEKDW